VTHIAKQKLRIYILLTKSKLILIINWELRKLRN